MTDFLFGSRVTRRVLAVVVAAAMSGATADAQTGDLYRAINAYRSRDYAQARDLFNGLLDRRELVVRTERIQARTYLAACHYALGEMDLAREALQNLFNEEPAAPVDPKVFGAIRPTFIELAEEIRTEVAREHGDKPIRPAPSPSEEVTSSLQPEVPVRQRPPSLAFAFVPFGVGQFAYGHNTKGALFLAVEGAAFLTAGVALALFEAKKLPGSIPFQLGYFSKEDQSAAYALETTYLIAFWGGVAVAIGGMVDAALTRPTATVSVAAGPGAVLVRF